MLNAVGTWWNQISNLNSDRWSVQGQTESMYVLTDGCDGGGPAGAGLEPVEDGGLAGGVQAEHEDPSAPGAASFVVWR